MPTSFLAVPAGAVSALTAVGPNVSVCAGPSVLGGSVLGEFSTSTVGPWSTWLNGTAGGSFRSTVTGYVRITATTSQANVFFSDMSGANTGAVDELISINNSLASASTTSEVVLASWKVPPGFMPANFQMEVSGNLSMTNNVNVKTLKLYANGLAGTAMGTSPSLASALNYTFKALIVGRGDGVTMLGAGMLASQTSAQGGLGISTTANPTLTRDYLGQETEFTLTITKAVAGDTAQIESLAVLLR